MKKIALPLLCAALIASIVANIWQASFTQRANDEAVSYREQLARLNRAMDDVGRANQRREETLSKDLDRAKQDYLADVERWQGVSQRWRGVAEQQQARVDELQAAIKKYVATVEKNNR